jgi:cell division protein FtsI (penicillin-binding protein 3)
MCNPGNGAYYQNHHVSSFVGFLPADDPRLLILVVLYDVGHGHFGGLVAAPVFSEIATGAVRRLDIRSPRSPVYETASLLPLDALRRAEALLARGSTEANAALPDASPGITPDFGGLSLRRALELAHRRAIDVDVKGSGYVVAQEPRAGSALATPSIRLVLASTDSPGFSPGAVSDLSVARPKRPHRVAK